MGMCSEEGMSTGRDTYVHARDEISVLHVYTIYIGIGTR